MTKLTRIRGLRVITESSYNATPTFSGSDALVLDDDIQITPLEGETLERKNIQAYPGTRRVFTVNQRVKLNFKVELATSGVAGTAPRWGRLLKACGWASTITSNSVTYTLLNINQAIDSVALAFNQDTTLHIVTGCRGNVKLAGKLNDFMRLEFEMVGIYRDPVDIAPSAQSWGNQAEPLPLALGNTTELLINGWSGACLSEFEFDLKNEVNKRNLVNCDNQVRITDRKAEGKFMIEAPDLANQDFFQLARDSAVGGVSFKHADKSGGKVAINIPNWNFKPPSYGDMNGITMLEVPGGLLPSSAGNDEVSLVLT